MKDMATAIIALTIFLSCNILADGHESAANNQGAFTTIMVSAKNPEKYIEAVKSNPALYEAIGADAGGYCSTISGHDYPGQLMMWTAFSVLPQHLSAALGTTQAKLLDKWQG